jgi:hypothetical protein
LKRGASVRVECRPGPYGQYLNVWTQKLTPSPKKPVMVEARRPQSWSMELCACDGRSFREFGDVVVVSQAK